MASSDAALWLHNKLGSTDDLWSGKTICSQLSKEKLLSIGRCFFTLQPHVKVKVMLSFLHLPRRNVEEWQKEMEEILALALDDSDHWVSTVAEILQTFPENGALKLDLDENNVAFAEILNDLKKVVKKNADTRMLPIECQFLNKTALLSVAGQLPKPVKHFALKRKPKSATLRAELLQKSTEVASNKKNYTANAVPVKVRSFAKKIEDPALSKPGITNVQSLLPGSLPSTPGTPVTPVTNNSICTPTSTSSSNCFLSASSGLTRSNNLTPRATTATGSLRSKEGGIKLIEIAEQPVGAKEAKRRRKMAEQEAIGQQKKEKEAAATATTATETTTTYTPDYAAGLVTPVLAKLPTPVGVTSSSTLSTSTPTYVPTTSTRLPTGTTILSVTNASTSTQQARENLQIQLQQHLGQTQTATLLTPSTTQSQTLVIHSPGPLSTAPQTVTSTQLAVSTFTVPAASNQLKKKLFLSKEQMFEAKEMFKVSNKVSRPEKALILGFIAGSRDNPCPKQGDIISIKLSENEELLQQPEGSKKVFVETFFQMNYATGEWKRIQKIT